MRRLFVAVLLVLLSVISVAWASTQTNERLRQLDESLARRDFYEQQRVKRINELRDGLRLAKAEGREFDQLMKLYEENKSYCYDSARHYAYACLEVAQLEANPQRIAESKNALVFSLISAGILSEARDVLQTMDRRSVSSSVTTTTTTVVCGGQWPTMFVKNPTTRNTSDKAWPTWTR